MNVDFSGYTDTGGRENNEDAVYSGRFSNGGLFIVADGLGGHDKGEIASSTAISAIKNYYQSDKKSYNIAEAIDKANESVLSMQKSIGSKAKTTIAAVYIENTYIHMAHVGDTRIYAFQNEKIVYQSTDHSASQLAVNIGEISVDEIRNHTDRNILTRALGSVQQVKSDSKEFAIDEIDALLICSDGFWEYVFEDDMISLLHDSKTSEEWIKKMQLCIKQKAPEDNDNHSAIAIRICGGKTNDR